MSSKKTRVDSVAEAAGIASAASEEIALPENVPLEAGDVPFFKNVMPNMPAQSGPHISLR